MGGTGAEVLASMLKGSELIEPQVAQKMKFSRAN